MLNYPCFVYLISSIHSKVLNAENLAEAIKFCMTESAQKAARKMGEQIRAEVCTDMLPFHRDAVLPTDRLPCCCPQDGVEAGVDSFHRHLPLKVMR